MPTQTPLEAIVEFGNGREMTLNDLLFSVAHHRGFRLATSYCILEVGNPHSEAVNEFMNGSVFTLRYGKEGRYVKPITFEVFSVENSLSFSNIGVRVVGVEPGFRRLAEEVKIRSFQNQTISDVIASLAQEAKLKTNIKSTQGKGTFVQPNISSLQFITKYLLPISTDSVGSVPYLFTIDNNTLFYQPPKLTGQPRSSFIIDPSIDTLTKMFDVKNQGSLSDFSYGNELQAYAYDWSRAGTLRHREEIETISSQKKLSKTAYKSDFLRQVTLPYDQQWMVIAETKNRLAKAQFVIESETVLDGSIEYNFDELLKFSIPERGINSLKEYSMPYYVFSLCNMLKIRSFHTHVTLKSNAFLRHRMPQGTAHPPQLGVRG